jgi:hypothetical protein
MIEYEDLADGVDRFLATSDRDALSRNARRK